jgi:leucyl/phenylalanyl-tRNA--protein transferase
MVIAGCLQGIFPMADPETGALDWYDPDPRAVIPLETFHVPRSLKRVIQSKRFEVRVDHDFESVIRACAAPRSEANDTWIDDRIINCYLELHHRGQAHSVEARRDGELVAGLYGVAIGGASSASRCSASPVLAVMGRRCVWCIWSIGCWLEVSCSLMSSSARHT